MSGNTGIFISIASYRDPELVYTVRNCYEQAYNKDQLFFSIVSQAGFDEHPDLSFIPENQIRYNKVPAEKTKGACWAREIASRRIDKEYFLQIDSHSRFVKYWDKLVISEYEKCEKHWGRMVFTHHPAWYKRKLDYEIYNKPLSSNYSSARWDDEARMLQPVWYSCEYSEYGYEGYFLCANSLFGRSDIFKEVPYDKDLYFIGEEPSLTIRLYTRNIKIINPAFNYMYHQYNPPVNPVKRRLHWQDNPDWYAMNKKSYQRLARIMTGDTSMEEYGIGSIEKFKEYQQIVGVELDNKFDMIYNWG